MLKPSGTPAHAQVAETREPRVRRPARRKPPMDQAVLDIVERVSDEVDLVAQLAAFYAARQTQVERLLARFRGSPAGPAHHARGD